MLQPHKGSSETRCTTRTRSSPTALQPHKGSSETVDGCDPTLGGLGFNPTRVRLKRGVDLRSAFEKKGFNPTRVRLKPVVDSPTYQWSLLQPHKGSSETTPSGVARTGGESFNPTRVRLKPPGDSGIRVFRGSFNPTRVRLKPSRGSVFRRPGRASTPQGFV